jgi:hypothetical protein
VHTKIGKFFEKSNLFSRPGGFKPRWFRIDESEKSTGRLMKYPRFGRFERHIGPRDYKARYILLIMLKIQRCKLYTKNVRKGK